MANSLADSVRRLMSQHEFEVDKDSINEDLTCTLCSKLTMDAYQTYCGCVYCKECFVDYTEDGVKYCRGDKLECKEETLVLEENVFKGGMLNRKILKLKVHCPNKSCSSIIDLVQMEEHLRVCNQPSMDCPYSMIGCDNGGIPEDKILTHLHDNTFGHSKLLIEIIHNLRNEFSGLKDDFEMSKLEISSLKEDSKIKDKQNEDLRREVDELRKEIGFSKVELENEESDETLSTSNNDLRVPGCSLVEKIEKMNKELQTTAVSFNLDRYSERKMTRENFVSPYFYSDTNGYKLKMLVYPGGRGFGRGSYLSAEFAICKGEYDDMLPWPCKLFITISIINQINEEICNSRTYHHSTMYEGYESRFNQPVDSDNSGYGDHTSIDNDSLEDEEGIVVNDSIIFRCSVSLLS